MRIRALALALLFLGFGSAPMIGNAASATGAATLTEKPEGIVARYVAPGAHPAALVSDTQRATAAAARQRSVASPAAPLAAISSAFLTRPYLTWHNITSVFDHCVPDYSTDGKVCEFDGSVGYRNYGVDPSFSLGYAQTPGGRDYISYDGHNGWDYALNYENVRAAGEGTVSLAGTDSINPCFGQSIIINHPSGHSTPYAHLSSTYLGA